MKKHLFFILVTSLFSLQMAFAATAQPESTPHDLVPASSLEEMMRAGVDEVNPSHAMEGSTADSNWRRGFVCFARNARGERFEAEGEFPGEAQGWALRRCQRVSLQCYELGCHRE